MKMINKAVVAMVCIVATQAFGMSALIRSQRVDQFVRSIRTRVVRGVHRVMNSGINLAQLNSEIQEKHQLKGYSELK